MSQSAYTPISTQERQLTFYTQIILRTSARDARLRRSRDRHRCLAGRGHRCGGSGSGNANAVRFAEPEAPAVASYCGVPGVKGREADGVECFDRGAGIAWSG